MIASLEMHKLFPILLQKHIRAKKYLDRILLKKLTKFDAGILVVKAEKCNHNHSAQDCL